MNNLIFPQTFRSYSAFIVPAGRPVCRKIDFHGKQAPAGRPDCKNPIRLRLFFAMKFYQT